MRPVTLAATAESSPSTRPVSSTTLDGVDDAKNSRQTTSPTIARAATAIKGATFLVVCTALDQCHDVGTCNASTGACSNPAKPNGTTCSDGNACTQAGT